MSLIVGVGCIAAVGILLAVVEAIVRAGTKEPPQEPDREHWRGSDPWVHY